METHVLELFAQMVELPAESLKQNLTLAQITAQSPKLTNSLDLLEAFARMANLIKKESGVRVRLPAFPMDTPILTVLAAFLEQLETAKREAGHAS